MKSILKRGVFEPLSLMFFALLSSLPASAETMRHFLSDIELDAKGTALVQETLDMDFEGQERHGIVRQIPIRVVKRQTPYSMDLELISITDGDNKPLPYREIRDANDAEFKIGDPEKVISGKQTYRIKYRVKRAINFINGKPEFYWNATGDQWHFAIERAEAIVKPPPMVPIDAVNTVAYKGSPGSTAKADTKTESGGFAFSCDNLYPGQGLTFGLSLPIGTMHPPTGTEVLLAWLTDWWPTVATAVASLGVMFALWYSGGRDQDGGKAAGVEWNPPKGLTPAEVGTLVDESCDLADVTSTMVDLAVRGYLKITEIKTQGFLNFSSKDYEFLKTDPPAGAVALKPAEQLFLGAVFPSQLAGTTVRLSSLKGKFYPVLAPIRQAVYQSLTEQKLFRQNPDTIRTVYLCVAGAILFGAVCAFSVSRPLALGLLIASLVVAAFAKIMPARTRRGSELTRESLGFARFVQKAEKERIRVLAAEDPTIFGRLLPYAMVLGAADKWATAFRDLSLQPPDWYVSSGGYDSYSTSLFVNDLGSGLRSMEHVFTYPAAGDKTSSAWSGGSAFDGGGSGGGFGGGGGSSW